MIDIEAVLDATIAEWRRSAFQPGQNDCLLSCADYGRALTGIDIGAPWRGTYSTEAEALAIVASSGGAVPLLGAALMLAGFEPVDVPERGDIMVIRVAGLEFGGICLGKRVAMRLLRGVSEVRFAPEAVLGAWRWPY